MKTSLSRRLVLTSAVFVTGAMLARMATAQVITPDPSQPVFYPDGFYLKTTSSGMDYSGLGVHVAMTNADFEGVSLISRILVGLDEHDQFDSMLNALVNMTTIAPPSSVFAASFSAIGPSEIVLYNKGVNITGTFQTELLSMNLSETTGLGPFLMRESPTLPSLGQTTITDIGGGLFQIDSFFDVFTELSFDGGATWLPDSSGPVHMTLTTETPEPSSLTLLGVGAALVTIRLRRKKA